MLKARDVWNEQENRREQRMAAMRPVLASLYSQIRRQSIHAANSPYVVFEIPGFVFGYPLFQMSEAREYLLKTLTESGFQVWPVHENYLLVSWVKQQKPGNHRPSLLTTYRPQVYDPVALGSMYHTQ
jgi:hypothetical protein